MKKLLVLAAAGALMASMTVSHAASKEVTYVATPGLRISSPEVPAGVGGYAFTTPTAPRTVKVVDANGVGVPVIVCQENTSNPPDDLPNNCGGEGDDQSANHCTANRAVDISNFKANSSFTVFVLNASLNCPQVGTAGTITVTW